MIRSGRALTGSRCICATSGQAPQEIEEVIAECVQSEMYTRGYADVYTGDDNWRSLDSASGQTFAWDDSSTYVRRPPYFDGMRADPRSGE